MRTLNKAVFCLCLDLLQLLPWHIWERQFTASLAWEWCSLATVPMLLAARFSVAPNTPWFSFSCPSHSFSISLLGRALPCTHPPLCNFPFVPTRYLLFMFHRQLNFWASPLPFLITTGISTNSTNQHCLTGSSEHLCSAEKDPKIAVTITELETDVMLSSPVICKINQKSHGYFSLTDNIIQPTICPSSCFNSGGRKNRST